MLLNITELMGTRLAALDGEIGRIQDAYFDGALWVIRYLIADTGSWLSGRRVLLTPHSFGRLDQFEKILHLKLSRKRIEESPPVSPHQTVSRHDEIDHYRHYGWPAYWNGDSLWGADSHPSVPPQPAYRTDQHLGRRRRTDEGLKSAKAITGHSVQTIDGVAGRVSGFLVDDRSWAMREIVVEAPSDRASGKILISTTKVAGIQSEKSNVFVNLAMADIQRIGVIGRTPTA
jgi:hypothetical protein